MAAINVNISISIFKLKQRNTHVLSVPPKALVVGCADVGGTQGQNNMERVDSLVKGKMMMKPSVGLLCQFSKSMVFTVPLLSLGFNSRLDTASESETY